MTEMDRKMRERAYRMVRLAVLSGDLVRQPCEVCGATPSEAHHEDYGKPLDVRWLCQAHHNERHIELGTRVYHPSKEALDALNWLHRKPKENDVTTVNDLLDRYLPAHMPTLARRTQIDTLRHIEILRELWGTVEADKLTARMIGQWMNGGPARGKIQRGKIVSVLATTYKYAVGEWFLVDSNPTRDLRMPKANKRTRYVNDQEFAAVRGIASPRLQVLMDLAVITGQRQGDLLKLRWDHIDVHGTEASGFRPIIHIRQGKTGKRFGIAVTEALEEVLLRCKRMTPALPKAYVVRNKHGERYSSAGMRSMWQRTVKRACDRGLIKTPYTFHDLRAKSASDNADIEQAAKLLGHQNSQMTRSVYDRSIRIVQPLR